jgi:hypothetical protein
VTRHRTPEQVGEDRIGRAAYPWREGPALHIDVPVLLVTRAREARLPEPVTWRDLNGRPPGGWGTLWPFCWWPPVDGGFEEDAIVAARTRERRLELALLAGTVQA